MSSDPPYRIAIVDSEEVDLFIAQRMLGLMSISSNTTFIRSGKELIDKMRDPNFECDYIILGFRLSDGNGLDFLDRIEDLQSRNEIHQSSWPKIIITSSSRMVDDLLRIDAHRRVDAFLEKPILPSSIKSVFTALD